MHAFLVSHFNSGTVNTIQCHNLLYEFVFFCLLCDVCDVIIWQYVTSYLICDVNMCVVYLYGVAPYMCIVLCESTLPTETGSHAITSKLVSPMDATVARTWWSISGGLLLCGYKYSWFVVWSTNNLLV